MNVNGFRRMVLPAALCVAAWAQPPQGAPPPAGGAPARKSTRPMPAVPPGAAQFGVNDVIQMLQAGVPEDLVESKIRKNGQAFDLTTDQMVGLKKAGASDRILRLLMDPSAPANPAAPAPGGVGSLVGAPNAGGDGGNPLAPRASAGLELPGGMDPSAARVPAQPGVYYVKGAELVKMDSRTLASAKTAGRVGHMATLGVKSVKTNAYLIGPRARLRVTDTSPVFYFRPPEGVNIDELVLVTLFVKEDRREMEVSAKSGIVGSKQGLRMETMRPLESQEIAPGLYKVATAILGRGEYFLYIVGSADITKGVQGKGYDFGIE